MVKGSFWTGALLLSLAFILFLFVSVPTFGFGFWAIFAFFPWSFVFLPFCESSFLGFSASLLSLLDVILFWLLLLFEAFWGSLSFITFDCFLWEDSNFSSSVFGLEKIKIIYISSSTSVWLIPIWVYSGLINAFLPFLSTSASLIIILGIISSIFSISVNPIKALSFSEKFSFNFNLKLSPIWYLIYSLFLSPENYLTSSFAISHKSLSGFISGILSNSFIKFS